MSSKRAKRHQLIVRVSNGNRTTNKQCGFKVRDVMLMPFRTPKLRCRNLQSELWRVWCREHLKEANRGGLFDKQLNKRQRNPHKFRKRAYHRAKEIENKSLKTEPPGLLQFVKAPFDPDPFEPFWTTKENNHD